MAVSRYVLKTLEGIDRPAIATVMPNERDTFTTVLDLGANVDCEAEHLLQFAVMGSALVAASEGKADPTRRLAEHRRRGDQGRRDDQAGRRVAARRGICRADQVPRQCRRQRHLQGNDRHRRLRRVRRQRRAEDRRRAWPRCCRCSSGRSSPAVSSRASQRWSALPVLNRFKARVDHRRYNGAALLGLRGLVFKSHGSADAFAFERALERAYDAARNGLLERVRDRIVATLAAMPSAARSGEPTAFDTVLSDAP